VREIPGSGTSFIGWRGEGEEARKAVGGGARRGRRRSSPGHHQRRRLEATGHRLRHGLDREQEGDSAKLTSCSMTAMGRCRCRAAMRGCRDHGCPPERGLRPRLRAPGRRGGVLVVLRVQREKEGEFGTDGARTTAAAEHFTSAAMLVREKETQGSSGEGKRARKNSCSCFIGQGWERERRPGQLAINGHGGRQVN
jgi:hypothetical protein